MFMDVGGARKSTRTATAPVSMTKSNWRGKYLLALNVYAPPSMGPTRATTSTARRSKPVRADHLQPPRDRDGGGSSNNSSNNSSRSRHFHSTSSSDHSSQQEHQPELLAHGFQRLRVSRLGDVATARRGLGMPNVGKPITGTIRCNGGSVLNPTTTANSNASQRRPVAADDRNSYSFTPKAPLSRERRCHTEPVAWGEDRVSAPIEIPTAGSTHIPSLGGKLSDVLEKEKKLFMRGNNNSPTNDGATNMLSWEEPSMMMGGGIGMINNNNYQSNGWPVKPNHSTSRSLHLHETVMNDDDVFRNGLDYDGGETDDENGDPGQDSDDYEGGIFDMEEFGDSTSKRSNNQTHQRRKSRTIFGNSSRNKTGLPPQHSSRFGRGHDGMSTLSESFVPPHQMIERDCFSIGLRDEFKRKPGLI